MRILTSDMSQIRDKEREGGAGGFLARLIHNSTSVLQYFPEPSGTKPVVNMTKKLGKKEIDK